MEIQIIQSGLFGKLIQSFFSIIGKLFKSAFPNAGKPISIPFSDQSEKSETIYLYGVIIQTVLKNIFENLPLSAQVQQMNAFYSKTLNLLLTK